MVRADNCRSAGPWFDSGWRSWFTFVTGSDNLTNPTNQMINSMNPITRKSVKKGTFQIQPQTMKMREDRLICIHRDLLPAEALVTHSITCHGRDHLVNIQSEGHSLVIVNVHLEPDLTLRQLRGRLGHIHPHWPAYPNGVDVIWVTSTSVTLKKDDSMFGTKHSPMATQERLLCSIPFFHKSLRLPNLITQEETPLFQGSIGYSSICLWLKHVISTASSHVDENLGKKDIPSDHAAVRLVILKPTHRGDQNKRIPIWMSKHPMFGSILQQLHDDHRCYPDPFCALAEFKLLLHQARKMTQRELSRQTPDCIGAKHLITSTALRAYRNRHLGTLMRCCEAWKPVASALTSSD